MTVFDIIKIYNPRSAKQVPPHHPPPSVLIPCYRYRVDGERLESLVFLNVYTSIKIITTALTQFMCDWWGHEDGSVDYVSEEGFPISAYCIYYLHDTLISTWVEGFTADPGTNPWAMVRPFWACTNVATPNWFTNVCTSSSDVYTSSLPLRCKHDKPQNEYAVLTVPENEEEGSPSFRSRQSYQ